MDWRNNMRYINAGLLVVVLGLLVWRLGPRLARERPEEPAPPAREQAFDWVDPAKGLKIIMFYAAPGVVERGEATIMCYGVANADRVRIDPPVAALKPALNRCIEIKPAATTTYTLTAENDRGEAQSQALEITVTGTRAAKPPAPAPDTKPGLRIDYFRLEETKRDGALTVHKLCFRTWNAVQVEVQPEAFPASKVFQGCFAVAPKQRTTYTLTARGEDGGVVSETLTLEP